MSSLKGMLSRWNLKGLSINAGFLQAEISFVDADRNAAWDMYVELLTRVTTQSLKPEDGDEKSALTSVFSLFKLTREIIKKNGPACINFAKIAIIILNQVIRPFTANWHKRSLAGELETEKGKIAFREDLHKLQIALRSYTSLLAEIASVEDISTIGEN